MKQSLINLLPPATVAAIWAFWGVAPAAWTQGPWAIIAVGLGTLAFVQLLELVFERHEGWRINGRELLTDVFYVAFGYGVIGFLSDTLVNGPLGELKEAWGIGTPWLAASPFLVQVLVVMFVFEFGQYWMHRAMHNWTPLWLTHAPHHHITQLNAMKGFIGNPIELFLISLGITALLDVNLNALFAAITAGGAIATYAHANVRADPPIWYGYFFTTIRNHSLHHTALSYEDTRCNYGNSVIFWDRVFGTYKEGESEVVGQDDRKRLSIKEQWLFPLRPWLEKRKTAA
ncbi:sterol desaturase/sphingolipid hydroxylase (fatty acid hydroxylase superfamily) [Erythromicrobium ramosum]|uniref:Fatty acid hydroxylase family protein n=1 Tax=Erythrobacter ramosus TaxID=35811 RepID=A0A6I4UER2_9SPHN|nr:sterol desaturase/sphingolipid hydroxylase (fatty acid hydroxylase superfamily) [Erythrobacter ramosus]MXP37601.1 fatty acid hydroxylase family protein [Erythrobacter ramosus]